MARWLSVDTGEADNVYLPRGVLEEVMAHEAVHAALDSMYLSAPAWRQAQKSNVMFLSEYARNNPDTEDLAESYGAYLIYKTADRHSESYR